MLRNLACDGAEATALGETRTLRHGPPGTPCETSSSTVPVLQGRPGSADTAVSTIRKPRGRLAGPTSAETGTTEAVLEGIPWRTRSRPLLPLVRLQRLRAVRPP